MDNAENLDLGAASGGSFVGLLIYLAIVGLTVASTWKLYVKAGQPGWACLVPVYNLIVLTKIVGRPTWWVALYMFTPVSILIPFDMAKSFGKEVGFAVGMLFLPFVFFPMLAFGSANYIGPVAGGPSGGGQSGSNNTLRAA